MKKPGFRNRAFFMPIFCGLPKAANWSIMPGRDVKQSCMEDQNALLSGFLTLDL
jgi:hypothetical protein